VNYFIPVLGKVQISLALPIWGLYHHALTLSPESSPILMVDDLPVAALVKGEWDHHKMAQISMLTCCQYGLSLASCIEYYEPPKKCRNRPYRAKNEGVFGLNL